MKLVKRSSIRCLAAHSVKCPAESRAFKASVRERIRSINLPAAYDTADAFLASDGRVYLGREVGHFGGAGLPFRLIGVAAQ